MVTPAQVVAEARSWIDTPYQHQARMKVVGADCIGLVIGVAKALGLREPEFDVGGYSRTPDGSELRRGCDAQMTPIARSDIAPGHVLLLRFKTEPQHMAIVGDSPEGGLTMIHAYAAAGKVVEHRLADVWRKRIVQAYALPGVA